MFFFKKNFNSRRKTKFYPTLVNTLLRLSTNLSIAIAGAWNKPLLYGEKYDLDVNEDCEWTVDALPKVRRLLESGSDADVIKTQFQDEMCASLQSADKKQLCADTTDKYYKRVSRL